MQLRRTCAVEAGSAPHCVREVSVGWKRVEFRKGTAQDSSAINLLPTTACETKQPNEGL